MLQQLKTMKVSEVMTRPVVCTSPDTSAHDILEKLNNSQISALPVIDENIIIGIFLRYESSEKAFLSEQDTVPPFPHFLSTRRDSALSWFKWNLVVE